MRAEGGKLNRFPWQLLGRSDVTGEGGVADADLAAPAQRTLLARES
jgi:hypothetical protein